MHSESLITVARQKLFLLGIVHIKPEQLGGWWLIIGSVVVYEIQNFYTIQISKLQLFLLMDLIMPYEKYDYPKIKSFWTSFATQICTRFFLLIR